MTANKRIALLHGWGASVEKLTPLSKELKKLGWKVFIPKLPGFDCPPPKQAWGTKGYAQYVLNKSQKIFGKEKFFLFGHSFGGKITAKLAATNNQSLLGIILCAPSGFSRANPFKRVVFLILAKTGKGLFAIPKIGPFSRKLLYKMAREHDYEKTQGVMKETFKKVIEENLKITINKVRIPVLLLWGKQDKMVPIKDACYVKKNLPQTRLAIFNQEGHQLPYNKPKEIAQKINQWSQNLS